MAAPLGHRQTRSMNDEPHRQTSPQVTRFFDWIRSIGIDRGHDRWFAGVCGGIAARTGLDPLIIRGIAIVLAILGGPALFAYAIGWALLPDASGRIHAEQAFRGVFEPAMAAIGALILITLLPFTRGLWWQGAPLAWGMPNWLATTFTVGWSIAVTVGIVWLVIFLLRRIPAPDSAFRSPAPASSGASAPFNGASTPPSAPSGSFATAPAGSTDAAGPAAAAAASTAVVWEATSAGRTTASTFSPGGAPIADGVTDPTAAVPPVPPVPPAAQRSAWDALMEQKHGSTGSADKRNYAHHNHDQAHRHHHPGAGFTAIALGLALTLGAGAAAIYSGAFAGGVWSGSALLIGLSFALGILALGIIVSGIRGRSSGAMGGFAFLAAAGLLALGILPAGTQFSAVGSPTWTVSSSSEAAPAYAIIAGTPTVDLTALTSSTASTSSGDAPTIDVWVGFGATELLLPANRPVNVEVNTLAGGVEYEASSNSRSSDVERGGVFFHDVRTVNGVDSATTPTIRVWTLAGQVTVSDTND